MKSVYYYLSVLIIFLSACHTNKSELVFATSYFSIVCE